MTRFLAATAVLVSLAGVAHAQTRNPVRDLATIYGARPTAAPAAPAAVQAAYQDPIGARTGEPQPTQTEAQRNFGFRDYGRVSGGFPVYGDPTFPAGQQPAADQQAQSEGEQQGEGQEQQQAQNEEFGVSEGFFFDNYTSGSGFGVYGGEAVTGGGGDPRIQLPSAGQTARSLGLLPDGYAQSARGRNAPPVAPADPD
jgi:hypothetical protein